jgi:PAS domain S-box-containing protein
LSNPPAGGNEVRTLQDRVEAPSSKDAYVSIFENAVEGIFQTLPDGRYLRVNPALARIYGYDSPADLMDNLTDIAGQLYVDARSRPRFLELMEAHDVVHDFQTEIRCKDGSARWISENARVVRDATGHVLYYEGFVVDITERVRADETKRRLEEELHRAQRMTALGSLAGGIAHDIKTLLHIVDGHADMARDSLKLGDAAAVTGHLDRIESVVQRGNELVERIGAFGRKREDRIEPVAVDALVLDVIRMLQATLPRGVEIRQQIELESGLVLADPTQIFQIVINLCTNALRAMGEGGGTIVVGLRVEKLDANSAGRMGELSPGDYLRLTVADDGPGMDTEVAKRAFEPFYSTKDSDEGMSGFGLAIVEGIVQGLGGAVRLESAPNAGAKFTIYLPLYEQSGAKDESMLSRFGSRYVSPDVRA